MPRTRCDLDIDNGKNYTGLRTSRRSRHQVSLQKLERQTQEVEDRHAEALSIDQRVRSTTPQYHSHELALLMSSVHPTPHIDPALPTLSVFTLRTLRPVPCDICSSSRLCRKIGIEDKEPPTILCQGCIHDATVAKKIPQSRKGTQQAPTRSARGGLQNSRHGDIASSEAFAAERASAVLSQRSARRATAMQRARAR